MDHQQYEHVRRGVKRLHALEGGGWPISGAGADPESCSRKDGAVAEGAVEVLVKAAVSKKAARKEDKREIIGMRRRQASAVAEYAFERRTYTKAHMRATIPGVCLGRISRSVSCVRCPKADSVLWGGSALKLQFSKASAKRQAIGALGSLFRGEDVGCMQRAARLVEARVPQLLEQALKDDESSRTRGVRRHRIPVSLTQRRDPPRTYFPKED